MDKHTQLGITFVGTAGIQRGKELIQELTTAIENLEQWKLEGLGGNPFTEKCGCGVTIADFTAVHVTLDIV
jgi:hypothetical protein